MKSLDRKIRTRRMGHSSRSRHPSSSNPSQDEQKQADCISPGGLTLDGGLQLKYTVKGCYCTRTAAESDNCIHSFHLKLFKNKTKVATFLWSNPIVSVLPPFVHPFICFITSALILEQSWLLLEALSPERLLSLSSCSLIPETLLLCPPPHLVASGLFIPQALNLF